MANQEMMKSLLGLSSPEVTMGQPLLSAASPASRVGAVILVCIISLLSLHQEPDQIHNPKGEIYRDVNQMARIKQTCKGCCLLSLGNLLCHSLSLLFGS
jgi:hypothetical protein